VYSERYVKDLPLARALEPDVVVAWAMKGAPPPSPPFGDFPYSRRCLGRNLETRLLTQKAMIRVRASRADGS
jgi:hypothetical protein